MNPEISIILPTFNGGKYIKRAIESVFSQTFTNWELFIIDDGSTDDTKEILNLYLSSDDRIIYLKNKNNLGIQKTLNIGLKEAKGEYIARIDDDDEWTDKDKLKKQIEFLDTNKDYSLVGTGVIVKEENGIEIMRYLLPETDKKIKKKILLKNCFVHSSVLFRKNIVKSIGGYSEEYETKNIEDYDLWLRIGLQSKLYNLPIFSVKYMRRLSSISSKNKLNQLKKCFNLIKKYKNKYPNYKTSYIFRYFIIKIYYIFNFFALRFLKDKIIKMYKSS